MAGRGKQYQAFALSIDDGSVKPGWPVDMASTVTSGSTSFLATVQGQRAALALVNGVLYIPFGGLAGDCGDYHGWVVAIPIANPKDVQGWATVGRGGGIWGPGGAASDGNNVYVTTGNTIGVSEWTGGEAVLSFPAASPLSATPSYWAPTSWALLDGYDNDLGGSGPIVFDLPGAAPSHLVFLLGKSGTAYLGDANNLGGISAPVASTLAGSTQVINATSLYTTATATYVAFRAGGELCTGANGNAGTDLTTLKVGPGSPPKLLPSWCAIASGYGSTIVTTTDGHNDAIVWAVGSTGNDLLQGFDGDTGATIFAGGGAPITGSRRYNAPIAAKGRIFVPADGAVAAFTP